MQYMMSFVAAAEAPYPDPLPTNGNVPFGHIVRLIKTALHMRFAGVVLVGADEDWRASMRDLPVSPLETLHPLLRATLEVEAGDRLVVQDIAADSRFCRGPVLPHAPDAVSFTGVPLTMTSGERVGVVWCADPVARLPVPERSGMLDELAHCVVRELELRQRAACDDLTGYLTRQPFFENLQRLQSEFVADGTPGTLAILDIDHFKSINDEFGHASGDEVLRAVSTTCRTVLGRSVSYGRLGGEEFAFAFPGVGLDRAVERLDAARRAIEAIRLSDADHITVTASLGVATLSDDIPTVSAWCRMADAALYGAKQAGRNRILVSRGTRALPSGHANGTARLDLSFASRTFFSDSRSI